MTGETSKTAVTDLDEPPGSRASYPPHWSICYPELCKQLDANTAHWSEVARDRSAHDRAWASSMARIEQGTAVLKEVGLDAFHEHCKWNTHSPLLLMVPTYHPPCKAVSSPLVLEAQSFPPPPEAISSPSLSEVVSSPPLPEVVSSPPVPEVLSATPSPLMPQCAELICSSVVFMYRTFYPPTMTASDARHQATCSPLPPITRTCTPKHIIDVYDPGGDHFTPSSSNPPAQCEQVNLAPPPPSHSFNQFIPTPSTPTLAARSPAQIMRLLRQSVTLALMRTKYLNSLFTLHFFLFSSSLHLYAYPTNQTRCVNFALESNPYPLYNSFHFEASCYLHLDSGMC